MNHPGTSFPDGLSQEYPFNRGVAAPAELDRQAGDESFSPDFPFFFQPAPDLIERLAGQFFFDGQLILNYLQNSPSPFPSPPNWGRGRGEGEAKSAIFMVRGRPNAHEKLV